MKMKKPMQIQDAQYALGFVTDDNNEKIEVSENIIKQVVSDGCSCSQYPKDMLANAKVQNDIVVKDKLGRIVDSKKYLTALRDSNNSTAYPTAIDVTIEATHDGQNLNNEIYDSDSMERDAATFVTTYKKPLLLNHNTHSCSPIGRITNSQYGMSNIVANKNTIRVTAHVTDPDAIPKLLDGRYVTTSIGAYADTIKCGFCGADILKDGQFQFCGHWRGRSYKKDNKDVTCNWEYTDMHYNELSIVNEPADVYSQIVEISIPEDSLDDFVQGNDNSNANKDSASATTTSANGTVINVNLNGGLGAAVDSLLGSTQQATQPTQQPAAQTKDSIQNNSDLVDLQNKINDLNDKLNKEIEKSTNLQNDLNAANAKNKTLEDSQAGMNTLSVEVATKYKTTLADSIAKMESIKGIITQDSIETRKAELMLKNTDDLQTTFDKFDCKCTMNGTTIPQTQNPGLQNPNDQHVVNNNTAVTNSNVNNNNISDEQYFSKTANNLVK